MSKILQYIDVSFTEKSLMEQIKLHYFDVKCIWVMVGDKNLDISEQKESWFLKPSKEPNRVFVIEL